MIDPTLSAMMGSMWRLFAVLLLVMGASACGEEPSPAPEPDTSAPADTVVAPADAGLDITGEQDAYTLCIPDSNVCYSPTMTAQCSADGTSYADISDCPEGTICMSESGKCSFPFCYPKLAECVDYWSYRVCDESGSFWLDSVKCEGEAFCQDGKCVACEPSTSECVDGTTQRQCAPDGSRWLEPVSCASDETCMDGACYVCTPGITECFDDLTVRTCSDSGVGWSDYQACGDGETCLEGACQFCDMKTQCVSAHSFERYCTAAGNNFSEMVSCESQYFCTKGACVYEGCFTDVLLLVDRSGSMSGDWNNVKASVGTLIAETDFARFGLMGFPADTNCDVSTSLDVPWTVNDPLPFKTWFEAKGPNGSTPLADALGSLLTYAPLIFGEKGGTIVVLSDGQDTCGKGNVVDNLTNYAAALFVNFDIKTYVIGYNYNGDASELNAIAQNGGTDLNTYIPAGNESELSDAFLTIVQDLKLCD